jgi:tetratricopeptide (TPR) repeat protein
MQDAPPQNSPDEHDDSITAVIPPQEVEAELQRIVSSPTFRRSPRHCRFLTFIVKQTLSGQAETIKEYLIGLEVFERRSDYDPGIDPIVRAEARRLRSRLVDYYQTAGKLDQVRIDLRKGTYVPEFHRNGVGSSSEQEIPDRAAASPSGPGANTIGLLSGRSLRRWLAAIGVVILAAIGSGYFASRRPAKFTDKDSIVLADFENKTGDGVFDDTLKQGLSIQLEQSPFLYLLSESKVNTTLKLMGHEVGDRLTPKITREICLRTDSTAMLTGSIARLGNLYVVGLKAVNCNTGDVLAQAQEQAASKEAVLKALDSAAITLRSKLGESLSSVQKYHTALEEATTPSLEALKAYSLAQKTRLTKGETPALPFFKRAVEIDPGFAMPYRTMAVVYGNLAEPERAAENARKAYELREKVSERERFSIDASYYTYATGELEKAGEAYELWQQTYPRDEVPYVNLGFVYGFLGNWEKVLEEDRKAIVLEPNDEVNYGNLGYVYASLNWLDQAEAVYKQAEERKLEGESLLTNRYLLAFLKGDTTQMAQMAAAAMGKPGTEDLMLATMGNTEAWYGKLNGARELTRRAMASAQQNDAKETAATYEAGAALREVEWGNREEGHAEANAALALAANADVREMSGLCLARAGDTAKAERLADDLDKASPLDTIVQKYWLPSIRAAVALQRKDPRRALELLQVASPIELSVDGPLAPIYVRGQAYLVLHDSNAAAAEFQKFIDHYGLLANFPWGALARLDLARAYALDAAKDPVARDKARTAYQNFFTLWRDADPDIPIYRQAKAEYAKLQ